MASRRGGHKHELVFLLDVDNTLLDNDRVKADMETVLARLLGIQGAQRFWRFYEEVRDQLGVVSFPETLKRFAASEEDRTVARKVADLINNWPYRHYLYADSLRAIRCIGEMGEVAILSDGDEDYQPRKITRAGLTQAVGGPANVLIYTHKEACLEDVMTRLPAEHYVLVDDKEPVLAGAKEVMGDRLTTVWVRQGHYAAPSAPYRKPDPDIAIDSIGELCTLSVQDFKKTGSHLLPSKLTTDN